MLTRLIGRHAPMIWRVKLPTKWTHYSLGRRVVLPLPTPYTLLDTHSTATITSRVSRAQTTATSKASTTSLPNATPDASKQEIFMLNNGLIFTNLRAIDIDYQLALVYACLKAGHIERALKVYKKLTTKYPNQKERLINVNIYNAFIEAYMKQGGESIRQTLDWFDEMVKQQIKPNLTTYAILIKGFIQVGATNTAHFLLMEMLKAGHSIAAFMVNRNISNNDLKSLNLIRKAREGDYFEILSAKINELLSSMGKSTTEPTVLPIDLSSVLEAKSTDVLHIRLLKASLVPVESKNMELYERQLHFEERSVNASIERLQAMAEAQETSFNSYSLRSLMWSWHQKLYPMIVEEQQRARNPFERTSRFAVSVFLPFLDAKKLSMLTIQQLLRSSIDRDIENDISVLRAASEVGKAIEMEYYTEKLCKRKNGLIKTRRLNLQVLYSSGQLFDMHTSSWAHCLFLCFFVWPRLRQHIMIKK
jgi:DNA-directed RNA polymerase